MKEGKARKKWYKRWWLWVIIVIVVIVIAASQGNGDGDKTTADSNSTNTDAKPVDAKPSATDKPKEEENRTITAAGQTIQTKNFKITVENLEKLKSDNQFLQPEEGKEFVSVDLLIENISKKDYTVSSVLMFNAYQDGFSTNEDYTAHVAGQSSTIDGALAAGKKIKGSLVYQLPTDWKELEVDADLTALSLLSDDGKIKIVLKNQ